MFYPVSYSASRIIQNPLVAIEGLKTYHYTRLDWTAKTHTHCWPTTHTCFKCGLLINTQILEKNCNKLYSTVHRTLSMLPYYLGKSKSSNMSQSKKPIQKTQFLKLPHHTKHNIFLSSDWVDMVACHKFYFQLRYRLLAHFSIVDHYTAPSSNGLRTEGAMCRVGYGDLLIMLYHRWLIVCFKFPADGCNLI